VFIAKFACRYGSEGASSIILFNEIDNVLQMGLRIFPTARNILL
jgi:hypothetical protein